MLKQFNLNNKIADVAAKNISDQRVSSIVSEDELIKAWGNADFGNISKREVILDTLMKVAQAWGTGHTAMCIVKELGLVESRNGQTGLSEKGLRYLLASVLK